MEQKKQKKESVFTKSHSLIIDKSPTHGILGVEDKDSKIHAQSYNFLAALRKVKRLSTENMQKIHRAYNVVGFPSSTEQLAEQPLQFCLAIITIEQGGRDSTCV